MFQMKDVGGKIAAKRKALDMTQMALADLMGVSFQAVSNWERGNSMPDIAKLPELSEALGISIDELLTDDAPARLVRHILDGDEVQYIKEEAVRPHTVADVAPILKPQQTEALLETVLENAPRVEAPDLVSIAPFVGDGFLHGWVMKIASVDNVKDIVSLAPFLSKASLDVLVDKLTEESIRLRALVPLAPFLSKGTLDKLVERALNDAELGDLTALAPFLSKDSMDVIVRSIMERETPHFGALMQLAPFLPNETLDMLAMRAIDSAKMSELVQLAPFLPKKTLDAAVHSVMEKETPDFGVLVQLAPFMYKETLDTLATSVMDEADMNKLVSLAPFLSKETLQSCASKLFESMDLKTVKRLAPFL